MVDFQTNAQKLEVAKVKFRQFREKNRNNDPDQTNADELWVTVDEAEKILNELSYRSNARLGELLYEADADGMDKIELEPFELVIMKLNSEVSNNSKQKFVGDDLPDENAGTIITKECLAAIEKFAEEHGSISKEMIQQIKKQFSTNN